MANVVIIGAGGMGREAVDTFRARQTAQPSDGPVLLGVIDDFATDLQRERLAAQQVPYLGTLSDWLAQGDDANFVVAIGSPAVRTAITEQLLNAGRSLHTLIHPNSSLGSVLHLGEGVIISGGAQISTNVHLGDGVHVNANVTVGHDAHIGSYTSLNPGSIVSGEVSFGSGCLLGAGAVVLQGLAIGDHSTIGAAACVVRNVPDGVTVKGVPAR